MLTCFVQPAVDYLCLFWTLFFIVVYQRCVVFIQINDQISDCLIWYFVVLYYHYNNRDVRINNNMAKKDIVYHTQVVYMSAYGRLVRQILIVLLQP